MPLDALERTGWQTLPCELDARPASVAAIGLIALVNDAVIESELRTFMPVDGIAIYANRIRVARERAPEILREMEERLPEVASAILPDGILDCIAFGCTSGAMAIGAARVAAAIHKARPGLHVTDPVSASLKALARLKMQRIALLTPYPISVNAAAEEYLCANGLTLAERATFDQRSGTISRVSPQSIFRAAVSLGQRDVDGVFISCTALRCSPVIQRIEDAIGKPVVTSNQALAWDLLRFAGHTQPIAGFGRLLTL